MEEKIIKNHGKARKYVADPIDLIRYDVSNGLSRYTVNLEEKTCTCRQFQLKCFTCASMQTQRRRNRIQEHMKPRQSSIRRFRAYSTINLFMLVYLRAPTLSLRPPITVNAGKIAKFFYSYLDNEFVAAAPGTVSNALTTNSRSNFLVFILDLHNFDLLPKERKAYHPH
ncbi:protein RETICULATA-RELATED 4 [Abeliophyllum distichum]|uniref:Protein RETICULATA-RELATED 4 n=1 Tax=Abeliophyllum distichum TaxID=126358 RepID=A0ABD1QXX6_9LAMI